MTSTIRIAALQMVSTPVVEENMETARRLVAQAAGQGAQMLLLPEYWPVMGMHDGDKVAHGEPVAGGPIQRCMADMARQHGVWLVGGTLPMAQDGAGQAGVPGKIRNATLVYNPQGEQVARYDKIHLFGFKKGEESYDESQTIVRGGEVGTFEAPFGRVGMSVCYDLRFPELYRAMGECALLLVPAAFTHTTGQAHWEVLLRARAIENQCYVLAAAQGGLHRNGRRTWGHSMLIDPWGEVKVVQADGEGVVCGGLDLELLAQVRQNLPALRHRIL